MIITVDRQKVDIRIGKNIHNWLMNFDKRQKILDNFTENSAAMYIGILLTPEISGPFKKMAIEPDEEKVDFSASLDSRFLDYFKGEGHKKTNMSLSDSLETSLATHIGMINENPDLAYKLKDMFMFATAVKLVIQLE